MINARKWTTPLLAGTSLLVAVTGIFMFFHHASGLAKWTHEWLGLAMVVAALVHVALNSRGLGVALRSLPAKVAVAAFAVLTLAAAVLPAQQRSGLHGPPGAACAPAAQAAQGAPAAQPGQPGQTAQAGSRSVDHE